MSCNVSNYFLVKWIFVFHAYVSGDVPSFFMAFPCVLLSLVLPYSLYMKAQEVATVCVLVMRPQKSSTRLWTHCWKHTERASRSWKRSLCGNRPPKNNGLYNPKTYKRSIVADNLIWMLKCQFYWEVHRKCVSQCKYAIQCLKTLNTFSHS